MKKCQQCGTEVLHQEQHQDAKSKASLEILHCHHCGLIQQAHIPTEDELKIYYSHHYRTDYKSVYQPKIKYVRRAGLAALDRVHFLEKHLGKIHGQQLIDIGAGGGEFVYMAHSHGFAARGIEPNQGYSEFARQVYDMRIDTATIDALEAQSADVITMFHVLEHMPKPDAVMRKVFESLKPGGYFFVEVPNILQQDASPHNIYFKAHLYYFSEYSLRAIAEPYFEVQALESHGNLKMLFKKRENLKNFAAPSPATIELQKKALSQKGWLSYLTVGGGWKKPLRRVSQYRAEAQIKDMSPKVLLDQLRFAKP